MVKPVKNAVIPTVVILLFFAGGALQNASAQQQPRQQPQVKTNSREERQEYEKKVDAKLNELGREIATLEAKADAKGDEAQREAKKELGNLTQEHQEVARQFEKLKQGTDDTWVKQLKPSMDAAISQLEQAYQKAASHFQ